MTFAGRARGALFCFARLAAAPGLASRPPPSRSRKRAGRAARSVLQDMKGERSKNKDQESVRCQRRSWKNCSVLAPRHPDIVVRPPVDNAILQSVSVRWHYLEGCI